MFKLDANNKARSCFCKDKVKMHEREANNTTSLPPNPLCSEAIKLPPHFYLENKRSWVIKEVSLCCFTSLMCIYYVWGWKSKDGSCLEFLKDQQRFKGTRASCGHWDS